MCERSGKRYNKITNETRVKEPPDIPIPKISSCAVQCMNRYYGGDACMIVSKLALLPSNHEAMMKSFYMREYAQCE